MQHAGGNIPPAWRSREHRAGTRGRERRAAHRAAGCCDSVTGAVVRYRPSWRREEPRSRTARKRPNSPRRRSAGRLPSRGRSRSCSGCLPCSGRPLSSLRAGAWARYGMLWLVLLSCVVKGVCRSSVRRTHQAGAAAGSGDWCGCDRIKRVVCGYLLVSTFVIVWLRTFRTSIFSPRWRDSPWPGVNLGDFPGG